MKASPTTLAVLAALAIPFSAQAQDFKLGAQVTLSLPQGDLYTGVNSKLGYGAGLHGLIPLSGPHAIVPRLDYMTYKNNSGVTATGGGTTYTTDIEDKTTSTSLGADYQYYFGGTAGGAGFYVLAGVGYFSVKQDITVTDSFIGGVPVTVSEKKNIIGFAGGGGYMFTPNIGGELRYCPTGAGSGIPTINVSFVVRF